MNPYMRVRILKTPPGTDYRPGTVRVKKSLGEGFCRHGYAEKVQTVEFPGSTLWEPPPPPPEEAKAFVAPEPKSKKRKSATKKEGDK